MIKLEFTFATIDELHAFTARLYPVGTGTLPPATNSPAPEVAAAPLPARGRKPAATPAQAEVPVPSQPTAAAVADAVPEKSTAGSSAPASTPATESPVAAPSASADEPLTYEGHVLPKIQALVGPDKSGYARTKALLTEFGVSNGKDMKPEQYKAFIARANEILGA